MTAQSTGSHRGIGGGIEIPETLLEALLPFPSPPPERPGELARRLVYCARFMLTVSHNGNPIIDNNKNKIHKKTQSKCQHDCPLAEMDIPLNEYQSLLVTILISSHPYHTKMSLRLSRICSTDNFFETRSSELENYLIKRGYKRRFIKEQITRAKQVPQNGSLKRE